MYKRILCYLLTLVLTAASFIQPVRAAEANDAGMKTIYVVDKITSAYGNQDIVYTKNGLIKKITPDSMPGATKFTYNKENQLVKKEVLTGEYRPVKTYTYDKTGKVKKAVSKSKGNDNSWTTIYKWERKKGKSVIKIGAKGEVQDITMTLGKDKRWLECKPRKDAQTTYKYDKKGRIKETVYAGSLVSTYKYTLTKHGNVKKVFYTWKNPMTNITEKSLPVKFHYKKIKVSKDIYELIERQQYYLIHYGVEYLELLYG